MEFTAEMIAGLIGGRIEGDAKATVNTVSSLEGGHKGSLTYLTNVKYEPFVYTTGASIVLVSDTFEPKSPVAATLIRVADVGVAILRLLEMYNAAKPRKTGISSRASVSPDAKVGKECYVGDFAVIEAGAVIGDGCRVGDYVEVKNSILRDGVKAAHLAYIGDAEVGEGTNIGCGTVFANYDGKFKHRTEVGKNVFVGCNANLIAPIKVGDGAFIAGGSTVTDDVPAGEICFGRARQVNRPKKRKE